METPAPPAWRGESPVDGGRLSERTACIAAAPPHHFVTREPPGYRTPPDGSPPLPACRPRGPAGHSPLLTKGREGAASGRHQHRCDGMRQPVRTSSTPCRDGFGLSLRLEWCSRSVELAAIQRTSVEVAAQRDEFKLRIKTWARRQ